MALFGDTDVLGVGIVPATIRDASEIWGVVDSAFARYVSRMEGPPAPLLADYAKLSARGDVHVLRIARRIVGVLVAARTGDTLEIETLAVRADAEGRGFGRTLLEWSIDRALVEGATAITLYTNEVMVEAQTFWTRNGFMETGRRREDGYDRVYYRRSLVPEGARA